MSAGVVHLRFRLPGRVLSLGAWLSLLLPAQGRDDRRRLIADGRVRLDGQRQDRAGFACPPGACVEIEGVSEELVVRTQHAAHQLWWATVDRMPWSAGSIETSGGETLEISQTATRAGLAQVRVEGPCLRAGAVLEALAGAAMPVVGDLERGGLAIAGGPRLEPASALSAAPRSGPQSGPRSGWPDEIAWRNDAESATGPLESADDPDAHVLWVSQETARAVEGGHPWILPDDASDPASRFRPGSLVRVRARGGDRVGWAHVEATPRLAARVWARGEVERREISSVEARVARALVRRRDLLDADSASTSASTYASTTNAFRLIHGEADGLPGLFVDRLGPLLRVLVSSWASEGFRERAIAAIQSQRPVSPEGHPWSVLELLHLRQRGRARFERVRWLAGGVDEIAAAGFETTAEGLWIEERGLRFWVDPGWDAPRQPRPGYGLFVDQRENRERLADFAATGGDWLNLFAHTGAFSAALLAAGAERVDSVDLSGPYLDRLEQNLLANADRGVEISRHLSQRGDVRRHLEALAPERRFRGIVIDPPTAAAAGRRFWSVKQDLAPLLRLTIARLEPGGVLLVTQNRAGPPLGLDRAIEQAAGQARRVIDSLRPAPAGPDHPSLPGFPEGDPFEGWLAELR